MTEFSNDLMEALPGLHSEMPEPFRKLARLLEAGQFEWLGDGRVVYLMNDAVESFLVFRNYTLTGTFLPDCDGTVTAELETRRVDFLLIVHQGTENAFTLAFETLEEQNYFYNYGPVGHFWVKGQEHIRQLEYRLAILGDKLEYLGPDSCNPREQRLALLAHFPPFADYAAVPERYLGDWRHDWVYSEAAASLFAEIAREADDRKLEKAVRRYAADPSEKERRILAHRMKRAAHRNVFSLLEQKLKDASAGYPDRSYGEAMDRQTHTIMEKALQAAETLEHQGYRVSALREEPFANTEDELAYRGYVMYWKPGKFLRQIYVMEVSSVVRKSDF